MAAMPAASASSASSPPPRRGGRQRPLPGSLGRGAGAARIVLESGESPQTLRARVTSPNGSTQRAIETMESAGVKDALVRAIRAAAERSRELGR